MLVKKYFLVVKLAQ